jgi:hypothetical protein
MNTRRRNHSQLSVIERELLAQSQPKNATITLPVGDFRIIVACIYEAQHHDLAFADRRADAHLSVIVQAIHAAITSR